MSVGSLFIPSHEVDSKPESYLYAQQGREDNNGIDLKMFEEKGLSMARVLLERSTILTGSGIAVSANRGTQLHIKTGSGIVTGSGNEHDVNIFVRHTRLVSVFLDNAVVRT